MKRRLVFVAGLAVLIVLAGCAQMGSLWDGMSGQPVDQHTDIPFWYHFGAFLAMGVSQVFAMARILLPVLLPLVL